MKFESANATSRTEVFLHFLLHALFWLIGLTAQAVDTVLDDCFQLISLFFMTIGRNNEAPAV